MGASEKPLNPFFEEYFEDLEKNWRAAGSYESLKEALTLCTKHKLPLREWQTEALLRLIDAANEGELKTGRRGRTARPIKDTESRFTDCIRYLRVRAIDVEMNDGKQGRPVSLEEIFELAAESLSGQSVRGSAGSVRASYQRVTRTIANGEASKYYDVGLLRSAARHR